MNRENHNDAQQVCLMECDQISKAFRDGEPTKEELLAMYISYHQRVAHVTLDYDDRLLDDVRDFLKYIFKVKLRTSGMVKFCSNIGTEVQRLYTKLSKFAEEAKNLQLGDKHIDSMNEEVGALTGTFNSDLYLPIRWFEEGNVPFKSLPHCTSDCFPFMFTEVGEYIPMFVRALIRDWKSTSLYFPDDRFIRYLPITPVEANCVVYDALPSLCWYCDARVQYTVRYCKCESKIECYACFRKDANAAQVDGNRRSGALLPTQCKRCDASVRIEDVPSMVRIEKYVSRNVAEVANFKRYFADPGSEAKRFKYDPKEPVVNKKVVTFYEDYMKDRDIAELEEGSAVPEEAAVPAKRAPAKRVETDDY